jgi:hypothetical protein
MKRLAFLSFTIATLVAPIQVQAQTGCVRFPQPPNPEAELRYLLSHPGAVVCPSPRPDPAATTRILQQGMTDSAIANQRLRCSMSGRVC